LREVRAAFYYEFTGIAAEPPKSERMWREAAVFQTEGSNVTKSSLMLVTIVSAIPGALVAFFLVMSLMNYFSNMPGFFVALAALSLLGAAAAAVLPVGVLLFDKSGATVKAPAAPKAEKPAKGKKDEAASEEEPVSGEVAAAAVAVSDPEIQIAADGDEFFDDEPTEAVAQTDVDMSMGQSTGELSVVEGQYTEDNLPEFHAEVSDANIEVFDQVPEEFDGFEIPDDDEDDDKPARRK
jgi:hypothetical protein